MRKSNQQSIGAIIIKLLKNQKLEGRLKELDVLKLSEELLGKMDFHCKRVGGRLRF